MSDILNIGNLFGIGVPLLFVGISAIFFIVAAVVFLRSQGARNWPRAQGTVVAAVIKDERTITAGIIVRSAHTPIRWAENHFKATRWPSAQNGNGSTTIKDALRRKRRQSNISLAVLWRWL